MREDNLTMVRIDKDLRARAKVQAAREGLSLRDWIETELKKVLSKKETKA